MGYAQEFQTPHRLAQGKPTNVDFQNPFIEPVEFSLQALRIHPTGAPKTWRACLLELETGRTWVSKAHEIVYIAYK